MATVYWPAINLGEDNTASNLGAGAGVFAQKVALDLQFKSLTAGAGITITPSATEIEIVSTSGGGTLAQTLALGNITGANDILVDIGQAIRSNGGATVIDLAFDFLGEEVAIFAADSVSGSGTNSSSLLVSPFTSQWSRTDGIDTGTITLGAGTAIFSGTNTQVNVGSGSIIIESTAGTLDINASGALNIDSTSHVALTDFVRIGQTGAPDTSSVLQVVSTTRGVLMPNMTTTQRNAITSPAKSLLIFNTTTNQYEYNSGTSGAPTWSTLSTLTGTQVDNTITKGNGTNAVQSSGWAIDDEPNGALYPIADDANDLGKTTNRIRDIYMGSTINYETGSNFSFVEQGVATQRLFIEGTTGDIGINRNNPSASIDIKNSGNNDYVFLSEGFTGSNVLFGIFEKTSGDSRVIMQNASNVGTVRLDTAGNSWFTGGNLGVGENSPQVPLHVTNNAVNTYAMWVESAHAASNIMFGVFEDTNGEGSIIMQDTSVATTVTIRTAGDTFFNGGDVAIGRTSADATLHVQGEGATSATNALLVENSSGTNLVVVRDDGSIGIGVDTPTSRLQLGRDITAASWLKNGINLRIELATYTDNSTAASGTAASAAINSFGVPTLAATNASVTTTTAATVFIAGAPVAGTNQTITNSLSLWVDSGDIWLSNPATSRVGIATTAPSVGQLEVRLQHASASRGVYITSNHSSGTNYGVYSQIVTPSSGDNIAAYFQAENSGAGNNYAIIVPSGGGATGLGVSTPTSMLDVAGDIEIGSTDSYYLGDPTTDGTWRFVRSGDDLLIQQREAGTYNTKSTISGA